MHEYVDRNIKLLEKSICDAHFESEQAFYEFITNGGIGELNYSERWQELQVDACTECRSQLRDSGICTIYSCL